jgi:hypothetical protein
MLMAIRLARQSVSHPRHARRRSGAAVGLTDQSHLTRAFTRVRHYAGALSEAGRQALMRNLIQYSCPTPSTLQTTVMTTDAMMISGVLYALLAGLMGADFCRAFARARVSGDAAVDGTLSGAGLIALRWRGSGARGCAS